MPIRFDNIDDLRNDIKRLADALNTEGAVGSRVVSTTLRKSANTLLTEMKSQTLKDPVPRSEQLHNALGASEIKTRSAKRGGGKYITIGVHRKDWHDEDYYPAYVEYGHGGPAPAPPHPYIRKAYDTKKDDCYTQIRDDLREAVDNATH